MPEFGLLEGLVLCFHYLALPWRRSAGRLGSAEFTYLHGSSALSVELKESGSSVGGLLTAASRLRPAGKWAGGGSEGRPGWSCALCGILLYSGLSQRRVWGSRAADCLAASPWGQPSLPDKIGRNW